MSVACAESNQEKEDAVKYIANIKEVAENALKLVNSLNKELDVENGIDLLDVKNQLMVQYILNLVQIIILKCTGKPIEGNAAIDRLIENRVVIERIRPIEQKLSYQIEKYIKIFLSGRFDENDPSRFRANPADLLADNSDDASESGDENADGDKNNKKSDVYVPPMLTSVPYDGEETIAEKQKKLYEHARKQALKSSVIQELKEEYLDTPIEIKATNTLLQKEDNFNKMKREYEETYFTRLPVTRDEKKKAKLKYSLRALGDDIVSFEDTSVLHGGTSYLNKKRKAKKMKVKGKLKKRRKN